jgi:hypothetical protein
MPNRAAAWRVGDLQAAILGYINEPSHQPKPCVWTANPRKISAVDHDVPTAIKG